MAIGHPLGATGTCSQKVDNLVLTHFGVINSTLYRITG